ncbi:hypothetical protein MXD62_16735 [Frankia sp. Mgl5]|uniref:hypothetical protein n=1 Tax=Frankia sp. Mgl5 TaxID=2933793 RepID=UPI002010C21A|nr:hypothetical protein [Frankia sp. Mgl5]MCK9928803.1 hypothetical protein [Frankia sp. Mgl5]
MAGTRRGAEFVWRGGELTAAVRAAALEGLRAAAELIGDASDRRIPVESGDLRESREDDVDEGSLTVDITYGGRGGLPQAYAIRQHEDLELQHPSGGQAKFLEQALETNKNDVFEMIADDIRQAIDAGGDL